MATQPSRRGMVRPGRPTFSRAACGTIRLSRSVCAHDGLASSRRARKPSAVPVARSLQKYLKPQIVSAGAAVQGVQHGARRVMHGA